MHVRVYATLRDLLGTADLQVDSAGCPTVRHLFRKLAAAYPPLGHKLWDAGENLTGAVTVLLNGRSLAFLEGPDTPLKEGDDLRLFPPVGGG